MINIKSIFSGNWGSKHRDFQISFNGKVWIVIAEYDEPDEMLVSLFDRTDGSSIIVNLEQLGDVELSTEDVESFLFKDLFNKDNEIKVTDKGAATLFGKEFNYIQYVFHNKKFGPQRLFDFYRHYNGEAYLLRCGSPIDMEPQVDSMLPGKLDVLLNSINANVFA